MGTVPFFPLTFVHEAMAADFRLTLAEPDATYARQAAQAAFAELQQIDSRLSRYLETSDIFRVSRLARGQSTVVHADTFDCLRIALKVQAATAGAFDVAYGSAGTAALGRGPAVELIDADCAVRVLADAVRLDLGGIGKGFALDRMAALLAEWDIASALLCASTSTLLAMDAPPGEPGWTVHVGEKGDSPHLPERPEGCFAQMGTVPFFPRLRLVRRAVSASGTAVRGNHIVDPRTGRPVEGRLRAWAVAPTAAEADALSTAFMVMSEEEVRDYCRQHPRISARLLRFPEAALE
jgi:FAD:protein FMN transferase